MSSGISPFSSNLLAEEYLDGVYTLMSDIVTQQIIAVPDADNSNAPMNLYLSATNNLVLQSKNDLKVDLAPSAAFSIYEASGNYNSNLNETEIFSLFASSNRTCMTTGSNALSLVPGDPTKTTTVGSMVVNENDTSQLLDTMKYDYKVLKDLTVLGNLSTTGTLYSAYLNSVNLVVDHNINTLNQVTQGNSFGNNMNLWINTTGSSDQDTNRIGYGFFINSNNEQLELYKYKRYSFVDSNGDLQTQGKTQYRKVAQFGYGVTSYDKESDIFSTNAFDTLDTIATPSNLASLESAYLLNPGAFAGRGGGAGGGSGSAWLVNSNANMYYYGNIGVNQPLPVYSLDVVGSIYASDTVISNNYATASDERVKEDICSLDKAECLEKISRLRPCSYNHKVLEKHKSGFIAQEVRNVLPDSVEVKPNPTMAIDDFHYIDHNSLLPYIVGAIQELTKKVDVLLKS